MECCIAFPRRRGHIHLDEKLPFEEAPRPVRLVDPKTEVTEPQSRFVKRRDASPPRASTAAESYSSSLLDEKAAVRCPTGLESYSCTEQEESYSSHRRTTLEVSLAQSQSQTALEASPTVGTAECQNQRSSAFRSLKRSLEPRTVGWRSSALFKKMGKGSKSSPSSAASNSGALSKFNLGAELQKREHFDRTISKNEDLEDYKRAVSEEMRRREAWDEAYGRYLEDR